MSAVSAHRAAKLAEARRVTLRDHILNVFRLVIKELRSIRSDPTMLILVPPDSPMMASRSPARTSKSSPEKITSSPSPDGYRLASCSTRIRIFSSALIIRQEFGAASLTTTEAWRVLSLR